MCYKKNATDVLTYRTNNGFDSIKLCDSDDNEIGNFYFDNMYEKETDDKLLIHVISFDGIDNVGKLYELLLDNKLYISYICPSYKAKSEYNAPRVLGIMVAFERLTNWLYDDEDLRNEDYLKLVDRMKQLVINNKSQLCDGLNKRKIKFDDSVDSIIKPLIPLSSCICKVIEDYDVSKSIFRTVYGLELTNSLKDKIAKRISKLRNDIAHGNMDISLTKDTTKDIKFIELIIYVLILSSLDLSEELIKRKIAWLFNINPFL